MHSQHSVSRNKMSTSKRLTLNKLISYVLDHHAQTDEEVPRDEIFEITQQNVNQIEEIKFSLLNLDDKKTISDYPETLKEIFDPFIKQMFRHGSITHFKDKTINMSLFDSILSCLLDAYRSLPLGEKEIYIKNMRDKLLTDLNNLGLFKQFEYKNLGWKLKDLKESIKLYKNNRMVIRFLSDYFNVNIFLLNILEDKIYAIYGEENYNIYKGTLFLSFYNDVFEPLTYNDTYLWAYHSEPLKKLINVDRQKIIVMDVNFGKTSDPKAFQIGSEDLTKYMKIEPETECEEGIAPPNQFDEMIEEADKDNSHEMTINDPEESEIQIEKKNRNKDIFCKKDDVKKGSDKESKKGSSKKGSKKESKKKKVQVTEELDPKMKLEELQTIAEKYGLTLEVETKTGKAKKKTKAQLIEELQAL